MMSVWTSAVLPLVKIKLIKPRSDCRCFCFNCPGRRLQALAGILFVFHTNDHFLHPQTVSGCVATAHMMFPPATCMSWPIWVSSWEATPHTPVSANATSCLRFYMHTSHQRLEVQTQVNPHVKSALALRTARGSDLQYKVHFVNKSLLVRTIL